MNIYSVFLPSRPSSAPEAEEAVFVRQSFNRSAFLITPLWALRRGYWLALALWLVWILVVALLTSYANLDVGAALILYALGAFAFGLEADRFREAHVMRNGFHLHGLTLGESLDDAESLYFGRYLTTPQPDSPIACAQPGSLSRFDGDRLDATAEADLLGLFPPRETQR